MATNVSNLPMSTMRRLTKEGRDLTYELKVIQQPERARACGSGAKCMQIFLSSVNHFADAPQASADRRPVDPPPVVELRIHEGEERNDITFSYNANFLLFTTLEHARPMAQGRVPVTNNTLPVLTGMPVAGMAYLDRPTPAGYFIFPDLSVRHEGKYRLSFNLYEELKEAKDADMSPLEGPKAGDKLLRSDPMVPRAHVHFRLEVKSESFNVYSAKKFPGLSESTAISRLVAEQGCRVRIRRDVRMRKRDHKPNDGYPEPEDGNAYAPSERFATPQHRTPDRPRSISHSSYDAQTPYSVGRHPSILDPPIHQQASFQQPPPAPTHSATAYSHLRFGNTTPGYHTPTFQNPPVSSITQNYPQSNSSHYDFPPAQSRQLSAPQSYGYQHSQEQPASYTQSPIYPGSSDCRSIVPDARRASASMATSNHHPQSPARMDPYIQTHPAILQYHHPQNEVSRSMTPSISSYQEVPSLPPVQNYPPKGNHHQNNDPRSLTPINTQPQAPPPSLPSVDTLIKANPLDPRHEPISAGPSNKSLLFDPPSATSNFNQYPYPSSSSNPNDARMAKRSFMQTFDSRHLNQPMHSGARPSLLDQGQDIQTIETDDGDVQSYDDDINDLMKPLVYKRADGSRSTKSCPRPREEVDYPRCAFFSPHRPMFVLPGQG